MGLQAKQGSGATGPALGDQVLGFARQHVAGRVGDGECFAFADQALRGAGAKSAADYGTVTEDADYVWGSRVSLSDERPGDIAQFRDYRYERTVETRTSKGLTTETDWQERPHHTAIVEKLDENGATTVLEQNVPHGGSVQRTRLFFSSGSSRRDNRTTTIKVSGCFWFYRPQPR